MQLKDDVTRSLANAALFNLCDQSMTDSEDRSEKFEFDDELAASYVGKYILVGITYEDAEGNVERQQQLHGVIASATRKGILISLRGVNDGQSWNMPPSLDSIKSAEPGTYTLRSTKEEIENPDLLATWLVTKGSPENSE